MSNKVNIDRNEIIHLYKNVVKSFIFQLYTNTFLQNLKNENYF